MFDDDALRAMVREAISHYPPRLARTRPAAGGTEVGRAEGAYCAYLRCVALALGGRHPFGDAPLEDDTAWRALHDSLAAVVSQAARVNGEPDYDAVLRDVHTAAEAHRPVLRHQAPAVVSMQERILTALAQVGQRARCQVSTQTEYANTGRLFYTAIGGWSVLVQIRYHFDTDLCSLHLHGPAIEALGLNDAPPRFRYVHTRQGWQLRYLALHYVEGQRITGMLDLLTQALATNTG